MIDEAAATKTLKYDADRYIHKDNLIHGLNPLKLPPQNGLCCFICGSGNGVAVPIIGEQSSEAQK